MKIVRFAMASGDPAYGVVDGSVIRAVKGNVWDSFDTGDVVGQLESVRLLPPCKPGKVVAVGLNYLDHVQETGRELPTEPMLFMKPSTSVIGPMDNIVYPKMSSRVDYEGEVAVVIRKVAHNLEPDEAADYILGYTCGNDVTARDLQRKDGQWTRAKSFDTFCPLGPYIVTGLNGNNLAVACRLNGEVRQSSSTAQLIFPVEHLVSFISKVMTLEPQDVILTGTPSGIGPMQPGDVVEVEVEGVGVLRNTLVSGSEAD